MKSATIQAGNNIYIEPLTNRIEETLKKEKNSVVWMSMQDKGSIIETAKLPSFNGPAPTFIAGGGISVQIPISETDKDRVLIRDAVLELAKKPEFSYLNTFAQDPTINWNQLILANKDWDIKQEGLTPAGAALLAIAVTIATGGAGTGSVFASMGPMGSAAMTSLTVQASIALVNNKGNLGATFKALATSDTVKGMVTAALTAGLTQNLATQLNLPVNSNLLGDRIIVGMVNGTSSALVNTAINGGSLSDNLQAGLLAGVATAIQGQLAQNIKGLEDTNYLLHKIAHAAAGCATAAIQKQACEAGAIGAAVGEVIAELLPTPDPNLPQAQYSAAQEQVRNLSKLVAGTVAAYAGYDVNTAANIADTAIQNNRQLHAKEIGLLKQEAKKLAGQQGWTEQDWYNALYAVAFSRVDLKANQKLQLSILGMQQAAAQTYGIGNNRLENTINKLEIAENIVKGIAQQNQLIYQTDGITPLKDMKGQNVILFQSTQAQFLDSTYIPITLPKDPRFVSLGDPDFSKTKNQISFIDSEDFLTRQAQEIASAGSGRTAPSYPEFWLAGSRALLTGAITSIRTMVGANKTIVKNIGGIGEIANGSVATRINVRIGDGTAGSGLEYAWKRHGGNWDINKSAFTITKNDVVDILQNPYVIKSPAYKSATSGNYVRTVEVGKVIGIDAKNGPSPTSIITIITDSKGNLVNAFPGRSFN